MEIPPDIKEAIARIKAEGLRHSLMPTFGDTGYTLSVDLRRKPDALNFLFGLESELRQKGIQFDKSTRDNHRRWHLNKLDLGAYTDD